MKLGIVTYQIAAEWDLDRIISACGSLGYAGVELRTTHRHGVEPSLSKAARAEVKKKFEDSPVVLVGLGSAFEYHSPDPAELKKNLDGTREFVLLARDTGAEGVKVRPNGFPEGVPKEKTLEQIGLSLRESASFAADHGVKIRLEVHGSGTSHPPCIRRIVDIAGHPNLYVCWNSNQADRDETGSIEKHFDLLKDRLEICHINELCNDYPWRTLFSLLRKNGFDGYCLAEVAASPEPERFLKYYKSLFEALTRPLN
ncbi:MAG TPA: sugar phosphate isomerase/epimerase [bacterium]|uniref:Xylose isomerase-like TIM barrel n=1 Tax=candidate division TA06 bacterium ADurb.Bin417 TaxID=1852828 RepID=A0A1V5MI85_UNCT6|nr:MAG: Xylose isomerase-like TIM barrel [candidate division TA06 bacterium ADurb.Bin417]HNQ35673.1 sugar phosphate isomerase/epimerase [bacterium]HNS48013.1 sugar phosphate isomerase/epimerase [bacterium]